MLTDRIIGVFKLSPATFEEVEHDPNATSQAALIVAIVALLTGLGSGFGALFTDASFFGSFLSGLFWTFVGWILWSVVSYFVGTKMFSGTATVDEMLRAVGFAYAPQMLAIIPCVGGILGLIWSLVAGFIAIRQGLDLDDLRTLLTVAIGFGVYLVGYIILSILVGGIGGIFA